jgi:hypothetical protein
MLEFVVMVAAYKIVHGCITLLVLYCLGMLRIKTITAKFQYLGSLHPVYSFKAVAAHIVCPLTVSLRTPKSGQLK